jgi:hypothetical protein
MYGVLPTMPITDLRTNQMQILKRLRQSPIVLSRQGHEAGVLVHPRLWNHLIEVYEQARKLGLLEVDPAEVTPWDDEHPALSTASQPAKEMA